MIEFPFVKYLCVCFNTACCWIKMMEHTPENKALTYIPCFLAIPCVNCGVPGHMCQLCGNHYCSKCVHNCNLEYSNPWVIKEKSHENVTRGETGGSTEVQPHHNDLNSLILFSLDTPNIWKPIEKELWFRTQNLHELNTCYIIDEDDVPRHFGVFRLTDTIRTN